MTFDSRESSRDLGAPVHLFEFRYSATGFLRYTDSTQSILYPDPGGEVFEPVPVERGNLTTAGKLDKTTFVVTLGAGDPLFDLFKVYPPSQQVGLIVRQGHIGETEFPLLWSGRVLSVAEEDGVTLKVSGEPFSTALRRPGLQRNWQYGCPLVLYGTQCGANKAAVTNNGTVTGATATTLTLAPFWNGSIDRGRYVGGQVEWTTPAGALEIRSTLRVSGDDLLLAGLIRDLPANNVVQVVAGCNHQESDCTNLHGNIERYGGQVFIPSKNPLGIENLFYGGTAAP